MTRVSRRGTSPAILHSMCPSARWVVSSGWPVPNGAISRTSRKAISWPSSSIAATSAAVLVISGIAVLPHTLARTLWGQHPHLNERWRRVVMVHGIGGHTDIGVGVVGQDRMAAVRVPGAAREVAAGHVHLNTVAGVESVMDITQVDGQAIDLIRPQRLWLGCRIPVHGADHTVHEQHGTSVGLHLNELGDKVGVTAVGLDVQCHPHGAGDGEILGQHLTAIHQAIMGQPLDRALVTRSGVDQHIATAQRRNWLARIIDIVTWRAAWPRHSQATVTLQIESVWPGIGWWPALRMAPIICHIAGTILDPGTGRIEHRRLIHDAGALAFEPVVEPGEIRIIWPEIGLVDKVVLVGANPQFLIPDPCLNLLECH